MSPLTRVGAEVKTTFSFVAPPRSVSTPLSVSVALAVRVSEPKANVVAWPPPSTTTAALPLLIVRPPVLVVELAAPVALASRSAPSARVKAELVPKALPAAVARPTSSPSVTAMPPVKALPVAGARMTRPAPTLVRPPTPAMAPLKVTSPPTAAVTAMPRVSVSAPENSFAPASRPPRVWVLPVAVFSKARESVRTPEARTWEKVLPRNWTAVALLPKAASLPATT